MTHRPIEILPDGTRVYADGHTYRPKPAGERVYGVRKPDHPEAVRFHGDWFTPLQLLPDDNRELPPTREDAETLEHRASCRCEVCRRPQARQLWKRQRKQEYRAVS